MMNLGPFSIPITHITLLALIAGIAGPALAEPSAGQLENWLKRFPDADTNKDGVLTVKEARDYRDKIQKEGRGNARGGAPRSFRVDPGWDKERFPDHAVCYKSPEKIKALYSGQLKGGQKAVMSFPEPREGDGLRIVGTGHSFMAPGYKTMGPICRAAGLNQVLYTHTGGGITGSTRYKWEQENGIFQFNGKPTPKLLASISNAKWDAMMWGPYFNDRPKYYSCWIDFCLQHNPDMKFYLSDAWLQLYQLGDRPGSEEVVTAEVIQRIGAEKRKIYAKLVDTLNESYPGKVYIMPTCDAMTLAALKYLNGELPGVEGINKFIGKKERSLWRDQLGHLGPGFDRLEGYVFYSTIYKKSPSLIENKIAFTRSPADYPSEELDRIFRELAWEAVTGNAHSGVKDEDKDGIGDP